MKRHSYNLHVVYCQWSVQHMRSRRRGMLAAPVAVQHHPRACFILSLQQLVGLGCTDAAKGLYLCDYSLHRQAVSAGHGVSASSSKKVSAVCVGFLFSYLTTFFCYSMMFSFAENGPFPRWRESKGLRRRQRRPPVTSGGSSTRSLLS